MFWEPEIETLRRGDLEQLQLERLKKTIQQARQSEYYKQKLNGSGVDLSLVTHIRELPFTTKEDLRGHFPWGFLSIEKEEVVRLHSSSGTTGNPTVVYHSRHDLASWANLMARSLYCAGIRKSDVFQNISGYGLTSEQFCEKLLYDEKCAIVPGSAFGESGEGFARVSYAYSVEHISRAIDRLDRFLKKLK